jgi:O-antigen/teichoic acid export membrane protein
MNFRSALKVSAVVQLATFVLSFASVLVVSRLLTPEEIGIFSVSVSLLGMAHIFREFGVGQYLVQAATVGREQVRAAFTVALVCSWGIGLVVLAAGFPMTVVYRHDGIQEVLTLAAINFFVMPFGTPILAILRRELQFERLAWVTIVGAAVQTGVTIAAAYLGHSYLSMAYGTLAMQLTKVVMLNVMRPGETLVWPTTHGVREVLRFGSLSTGAVVANNVGGAAPDLVFGRTLGFADVAFYSRGVGLQNMLIEKIHEAVRSVYFPIFASELRAGAAGCTVYLRIVGNLAAVTVPALVVLAVLADPLIPFVFGDQWAASAPIASTLCLYQILVAPYAMYQASLIAAGMVGSQFKAELVIQGARLLVLLSSVWLDLQQVVTLLIVAYATEAFVAQGALHKAFGLRLRALIGVSWKAYVIAFASAAGPLAVANLIHWDRHNSGDQLSLLVLGGLTALVGWFAAVHLLGHPLKPEIQRIVQRWMPAGAGR